MLGALYSWHDTSQIGLVKGVMSSSDNSDKTHKEKPLRECRIEIAIKRTIAHGRQYRFKTKSYGHENKPRKKIDTKNQLRLRADRLVCFFFFVFFKHPIRATRTSHFNVEISGRNMFFFSPGRAKYFIQKREENYKLRHRQKKIKKSGEKQYKRGSRPRKQN